MSSSSLSQQQPTLDAKSADNDSDLSQWIFKLRCFVATKISEPTLVDDIIQETLLRTYSSAEIAQLQSPLAYSITVAKSVLAEQWRKKKNCSEECLSEESDDLSQGPEQQYFSSKKLHAVIQVIDNMPDLRRQVFKLRRVDGLSRKQIAERLELHPEAVKKHITRAIIDLARAAEEQGWVE